jgi:hypothetical protein
MSDESLVHPESEDDSCDACAPTERDPCRSSRTLPSRGVALSVLWWLEESDGSAAAD